MMMEPQELNYIDIKTIRKNAMEAINLCQKLIIAYENDGSGENDDNMETANQIIQRNYRVLAATADAVEYNKLDEYVPQKFYLDQFLKDVVDRCQSVLRRTWVTFSYECEENLCVSADPDRLLACLLALITNSVQNMYSEIGDGEVKLKATRLTDSVSITLIDNGYGMESSALENYLDYDKNKGGLAVVKKFCDVIDSPLITDTSPDGGFMASFRLPLTEMDSMEMRSPEPITPMSTFSPYNIYLSKIYDAIAQFR